MINRKEVDKMYKTKTNAEIGKYLSRLIRERFSSQRQFCIACLKAYDNAVPDDVQIKRMTNRISQIVQGKRAVQLEDFPIFTTLLGVTCEDIISAGECSAPTGNHLINYNIAFSKDEKLWEEYVHREDKLILNLDEYGKSVIDYAIEFKNFDFLKYLIEKKYIWFVDDPVAIHVADSQYNASERWMLTFGGGTSIERRQWEERNISCWQVFYSGDNRGNGSRLSLELDTLQYKLSGSVDMRMRMICLALEHGEVEMLRQLRAREIPSLYEVSYLAYRSADCDSYYNEDMVKQVAKSGEEILNYFTEEFEIKDSCGTVNIFVFPYMMNLIDCLIEKNSPYLEKVLKVSLKHNQDVYKKLVELKSSSTKYYTEYYKDLNQFRDAAGVLHKIRDEEEYVKSCVDSTINSIMKEARFYENGNIILYRDGGIRDGLITNVIHVNGYSSKKEINRLIQQVNDWYGKIREKSF